MLNAKQSALKFAVQHILLNYFMVFLMNTTDIPSLHYLQAAVKGGLRLHPPIPITRRPRGDGCKIGEFGLPEETAVLINLYSIPRDPEAWDNPDEFCPQRFLVCPVEQGNEMETKKGQNFGFVLFGGGRRRCPGAKLAFILMNTTVAAMVQCLFGRLVQMKMEQSLTCNDARKIRHDYAHGQSTCVSSCGSL